MARREAARILRIGCKTKSTHGARSLLQSEPVPLRSLKEALVSLEHADRDAALLKSESKGKAADTAADDRNAQPLR